MRTPGICNFNTDCLPSSHLLSWTLKCFVLCYNQGSILSLIVVFLTGFWCTCQCFQFLVFFFWLGIRFMLKKILKRYKGDNSENSSPVAPLPWPVVLSPERQCYEFILYPYRNILRIYKQTHVAFFLHTWLCLALFAHLMIYIRNNATAKRWAEPRSYLLQHSISF